MKFCWILYAKWNIWQINFNYAIVFAFATQLAPLQTTCQLLRMLCRVFAFRYLMPLQKEYSVMLLLCSRCGKVVILNVFKTGINAVSSSLVFKLCSSWFQRPSGESGTRAPRVQPEYSITIYIWEGELACFVYMCHHPRASPTSLSC